MTGISIASMLICSGCARYRPKNLDPLEVQHNLQQVSLANLAREYSALKADGSKNISGAGTDASTGAVPNLSGGIGADEAGLAALVLNPALKTKRLESGIAAGQLVSAGLYPNPSFDNRSLVTSKNPSGQKSIEASFSMEVLRWQEQFANVQTKQANVQAVHYEILNEEWKTVSDARTAWWNVVVAQERLKLNKEDIAISERQLEGVKARIRHGAATALDLNLSELQHLKLKLDTQKLESDADTAGRALRQAIGLPYDAEVPLRVAEKPLVRSPRKWTLPELIASLPESSFMKAVQWRYNVSEGELRAAIARQYPSLRLGPAGTFDFDGHIWTTLLGFVASADLPLINRNQGEIKEKLAARDVAYTDYVARLQAARAAVAEAAAQIEKIDQRLDFHERELLPKGQESIQLTEKAYKLGEVSGAELLIAQSLFIDTERSHLDLLIEYRQALQTLEAALGRRLEDVPLGAK